MFNSHWLDSARFRCCAAVIVAYVMHASTSPGIAQTFVFSPHQYKEIDAPHVADLTGYPSYRLQQVYDAEDFKSIGKGPWTITGFDWRIDGNRDEPMDYTTERWTVKLSTTSAEPGVLSPVFAENIGPDEVVVFDGPVTISTQSLGPIGGPKEFDYGFELETPFTFDPSQGNLLSDHTLINGEGPLLFDFDLNVTKTTSLYWTANLGADSPIAAGAADSVDGGQLGGHVIRFTIVPGSQAGDSDRDGDFDQMDLVQVQQAAKYLTGQPATWGEGDWDGAPGGTLGSPPVGNGTFDQLDVIAALAPGHYLTGPYVAIQASGKMGDSQTSVIYNNDTGELSVDAPAGVELTSVNIDSAVGIFTGDASQNLGGSFDNDADGNIFKASFGGSFGSISFGNVAQSGLSEEFVLGDLAVIGSLTGGGDLGEVDLIYVPEPASALLLAVAFLIGLFRIRQVHERGIEASRTFRF